MPVGNQSMRTCEGSNGSSGQLGRAQAANTPPTTLTGIRFHLIVATVLYLVDAFMMGQGVLTLFLAVTIVPAAGRVLFKLTLREGRMGLSGLARQPV